MKMKKVILSVLCALCAFQLSSCSVRTHVAMADLGRSADAILVPLEQPTLYRVNGQWYMGGMMANVERYNAPSIRPEQLPSERRHPERYALDSDDMKDVYCAIPDDMAESIRKGTYTHSHAISFINRKWVGKLPEGKVAKEQVKTSAPDYFRGMSNHRLMQTSKGTYLLAKIGEFSADFGAIYAYPLAGLCTIIVDAPLSFLYSPPAQESKVAQPEEVE